MRPFGTQKQLAQRRINAVRLIESGEWTVTDAAHRAKVAVRTVYDWLARYRENGEEAIGEKPLPGRKPALSEKQLEKLRKILLKGPLSYGFDTELWTCSRVAVVIEDKFGVKFHRDHVWRILAHKLGWSAQKPSRRAIERDEDSIEHWKRYQWREIKKKHGSTTPL